MSFYPYIVKWDAVHNNVLDIEAKFEEIGQPHTVINSGELKKDNWKNVGDIRYYRQLLTALKDFDPSYDYMGYICGDVSSNEWDDVLSRAEYVLNSYNVGVYAPHLTHEPWSKNSCYLESVPGDDDLFVACQTDGIMIFIHRDIVKIMLEYFDYLSSKIDLTTITSGWGMDMIWCTLSMYLDMMILRDNKYIVNHPAGSSYDHSKASQELKIVLDVFNEFAVSLGYDLNRIGSLQSNIYGRMSHNLNSMHTSTFYNVPLNLYDPIHELNYHIVSIDDSRKINKDKLRNFINGKEVEIPCLNARIESNVDKFFQENPEVKLTWQGLKAGEIGCFGSHYLAWKYLKNSSLKMLTVFEDDIIVHDNFKEQYNNLINNAPKNWDIISIFVDPNQYPRFDKNQKVNYYIAKGYQDWSTLGYIISKSGAEKICKFVEENGINQPVDWYIFRNGHEGHFNVYTLPPYIRSSLEIDHTYPSQVQGE
jgi:GR25 family glycosyltransferase involved in LPS biosynthesis